MINWSLTNTPKIHNEETTISLAKGIKKNTGNSSAEWNETLTSSENKLKMKERSRTLVGTLKQCTF